MAKQKKDSPPIDLPAFRRAVAKAERKLKEAKADLQRAIKAAKPRGK